MEMYRIRPVAPNKTRIWKSQRIRSENAINFTMVEENFENQGIEMHRNDVFSHMTIFTMAILKIRAINTQK